MPQPSHPRRTPQPNALLSVSKTQTASPTRQSPSESSRSLGAPAAGRLVAARNPGQRGARPGWPSPGATSRAARQSPRGRAISSERYCPCHGCAGVPSSFCAGAPEEGARHAGRLFGELFSTRRPFERESEPGAYLEFLGLKFRSCHGSPARLKVARRFGRDCCRLSVILRTLWRLGACGPLWCLRRAVISDWPEGLRVLFGRGMERLGEMMVWDLLPVPWWGTDACFKVGVDFIYLTLQSFSNEKHKLSKIFGSFATWCNCNKWYDSEITYDCIYLWLFLTENSKNVWKLTQKRYL